MRDKRVRIRGRRTRCATCFRSQTFLATFPTFRGLVVSDSQANLARVNRDIKKIKLANYRLCESIINSSNRVRNAVSSIEGNEVLLASYFTFAAETGTLSMRGFERKFKLRLITELQKFAIKWVNFICEDCIPSDGRTFKWAVAALEFARLFTKGENIFKLSPADFAAMRSGVASCMTLLISHFDILGARSSQEQSKEKESLTQRHRACAL